MAKLVTSITKIGRTKVECSRPGHSLFQPLSPCEMYQFAAEELVTQFDSSQWSRSTPRDTLIALRCYEELMSSSDVKSCCQSNEKIGLFGGFVNGPLAYDLAKELAAPQDPHNLSIIKKNWPPRQHLKQSAPLKLAHLSMVYRFRNPIYCATDPLTNLDDCLEMAEVSLESADLDLAIVLAGFSLEEPQTLMLYQNYNTNAFHECGVAILLEKSGDIQFQKKTQPLYNNLTYGPCTNFILSASMNTCATQKPN